MEGILDKIFNFDLLTLIYYLFFISGTVLFNVTLFFYFFLLPYIFYSDKVTFKSMTKGLIKGLLSGIVLLFAAIVTVSIDYIQKGLDPENVVRVSFRYLTNLSIEINQALFTLDLIILMAWWFLMMSIVGLVYKLFKKKNTWSLFFFDI